MEFFLHDGDEHIYREGDPDLSQDCILGGAIEGLDSQMLFEPTEEELHLPTAAIQFGHCDCGYREVVGKEGKTLSCFLVEKFDKTQFVRIVPMGVVVDKSDCLIASQPGIAIHWPGVEPPIAGIALCPGEEEGRLIGNVVQTFEVEIAPIEDIERSDFDGKQVQYIHVVNFSRSNVHPTGDIPSQIEQRMGLDSASVLSELRPGEERQTETDGGGIEGVSRLRQIYPKAFVQIECPGFANQCLSKVGPDSPVSVLVGMGQCTPGDRRSHTPVIEFGLMRAQTAFDISQAFPVGKLGEGHAEVLIHAGEGLDVSLPIVPFDTANKFPVRKKLHYLSKDCAAAVHWSTPFRGEYNQISNRFGANNENY